MRGGRRRSLIVTALVMGLAICAEAQAAEVATGPSEIRLGGPPVTFTAAAGETNQLTVSSIPGDPDAAVFSDAGASISPGEGCVLRADSSVVCRAKGLAGVRVRLEDGDDRLNASALVDQRPPPHPAASSFFAFTAVGGGGVDELTGADASFSCLRGEEGDDVLTVAVSAMAPKRAVCPASGGDGNDRIIGNDSDNFLSGGPGQDSIVGAGGSDGASGGDGEDSIDLGPGGDFGGGGGGDDRISGGDGNDYLEGSRGDDRLLGGADNDRFAIDFRSAEGSDELRGGPGRDTARFSCPSCQVSLNARPDDGEKGKARDNALQIENVITSSTRYDVIAEATVPIGRGDDLLIGDVRANVLDGRRGPDVIVGGEGSDRLLGAGGSDRLRAADGESDLVSCGRGRDRATVDLRDRVRSCEQVRIAGAGH